jgi:hypothetical protein
MNVLLSAALPQSTRFSIKACENDAHHLDATKIASDKPILLGTRSLNVDSQGSISEGTE